MSESRNDYDGYEGIDSDSDSDGEPEPRVSVAELFDSYSDHEEGEGGDVEMEDSWADSSSVGASVPGSVIFTHPPTLPPSSYAPSVSNDSLFSRQVGDGDMSSFASSYDDRLEPESSRPSSPTLSGAGTEIDLREQYGRRVTALGRTYGLPGDSEEWYRLDRQHRMFIEMQGGKWYPPAMERVMKSNIQGEKRVLDLGCGNGAWARDVGLHFPLCDVLAIDLIPIKDTRYLPSNVKSEVDDIDREDGLLHLYGQFDVVHCRLVASGVRDYYELIERIVRILRPGGIMEVQEFDFRIYDRDHREIEVSVYSPLGPPYWARFMAHMNQAIQKKGGDVDAARHLWKWVTSHEAFEDITYRDVWVPCIPGDDSRYAAEVYPILRENITAFLKSGRPMLLANGMSEAVYDTIEQNTLREMHESNEPQYTRLQCIYATKRHVVGEDSF